MNPRPPTAFDKPNSVSGADLGFLREKCSFLSLTDTLIGQAIGVDLWNVCKERSHSSFCEEDSFWVLRRGILNLVRVRELMLNREQMMKMTLSFCCEICTVSETASLLSISWQPPLLITTPTQEMFDSICEHGPRFTFASNFQ
ncbi:hypothetical protein AVEN_213866-1 [Araneus ventricosus]|uniref:Uncharacterized protein n=1 Tax=Araneus ventricosus TaxID=182803 RepID=A0A4Y2R0M6_ARAVE|nr:hypothetical protein AVEN_213866-1 [Araneus ventricosus]